MKNVIKALSLQFFAVRFGFNEEELSYGIATFGDDEKIPVILIKGKRAFINVLEDLISPMDIPSLELVFHSCTFTETPDGYVFETKGVRVALSRVSIEKYYAMKYYSEMTDKHVTGDNY